jgi:hypothetical protein
MLKAMPQVEALPGRIFQEHLDAKPGTMTVSFVQRPGNASQARLFA